GPMPDKPLIWLGSSRRDLRTFPALARRLASFQLRRVQQGLDPDDWKPMQTVGPGVREIRIHIAGAHRVFYLATRAEALYVLHAFEKKTQKTERPRSTDRPGPVPCTGEVEGAAWQRKTRLGLRLRRGKSSGTSGSRGKIQSTS